jgi:preprotein translocase subunit SecG
MQTLVTVVHVFTCVLLVLVVLIQSGKGAEISSSFAGSSQTVFGSSGGANFFTRFTAGAAAVFFATSVILTLMGSQGRKSLFEGVPSAPTAPMNQPAGTTPASAGQAPAASAPASAPAPAGQAPISEPPAAGVPAAPPAVPAPPAK